MVARPMVSNARRMKVAANAFAPTRMNSRVLTTGASGFVGRDLSAQLDHRGRLVTAALRRCLPAIALEITPGVQTPCTSASWQPKPTGAPRSVG